MYEEFEQELKKLSRSQGRILIKLVHRQTGITIFELIRELRTGLKAFFYQTTASLFKLSLKDKYNPEDILEDYLIEDILQRAFAEKYLVKQNAKIDYNLILCIQYGKVKDEKYLNSMKEIFQMSAKTFYGFEDILCEELKKLMRLVCLNQIELSILKVIKK